MYILKIKKAELVPDQHGSHIKITMIGLYKIHGEDLKWIKWVKLNERTLEIFKNGQAYLNNAEAEEFGIL